MKKMEEKKVIKRSGEDRRRKDRRRKKNNLKSFGSIAFFLCATTLYAGFKSIESPEKVFSDKLNYFIERDLGSEAVRKERQVFVDEKRYFGLVTYREVKCPDGTVFSGKLEKTVSDDGDIISDSGEIYEAKRIKGIRTYVLK